MDQQLRSKISTIRASEEYHHPETPPSQAMLAKHILAIADEQSLLYGRAAQSSNRAAMTLRQSMLSNIAKILIELHQVKNGLRAGETALTIGQYLLKRRLILMLKYLPF